MFLFFALFLGSESLSGVQRQGVVKGWGGIRRIQRHLLPERLSTSALTIRNALSRALAFSGIR